MYAAINHHDLALVEQLLAEGCVRHFVKGPCPIAGDHVGRDEVLASYGHVMELTGGDHLIEVGGIVASETVVASYHHESGSRSRDGARLDADMLVRWRLEGNRVVEIWDFANDVPHVNAFLT